ncbi:3-dehydroquinate synthase [Luminiphilus sp.]|jgi:3-dehydroquinate synthase|nr:3-dehydroquinate synthase [Luminiphilus sp.]MDA8985934.1 3-dehydroquinate synthase [Luminiphilus sp.]MDB2644250.1 3-dehydroquinate synthase [Luminiphilus sp.]
MSEQFHTVGVNLGADAGIDGGKNGGEGRGKDRSYAITIGRGLLVDSHLWSEIIGSRGVVLVTDDQVGPLYAERLQSALPTLDRFTHITLPAGEQQKSMASVQQILDAALADRHERQSLFLALGGGVVGDMTGFAASLFLRGAEFVQIPTTLLAQVDSSVGGKTGVNHPMGKNLIGAFHQPKRVIIDLDTLSTLGDREYAAGLAEVIKYGLIRDAAFFQWLVAQVSALQARDIPTLASAIERSCAIKAAVVMEDEQERGVRAHLNFGHTFGHAIERLQGYGEWLHGEAVAAGMVMAARLSVRRGNLESAVVDQLLSFQQQVGLPVKPPAGLTAADFLDAMASDKKVTAGKIRYILLNQLGEACVAEDVTLDDIAAVIDA